MDATVVVVVLFVYAIFTSLGGSPRVYSDSSPTPKPFYAPKSESGRVVSEKLAADFDNLPPADYFSNEDEESLRLRFRKFILNYAPKCSEDNADQIASGLVKYSKKSNINPKLFAALVARESRFNRYAVSSHGAQGLGQMLPSTSRYMGVDDPFDIYQNLKGTAKYVRYLLDKWKGQKTQVPLALGSYLEGPNAIKRKGLYRSHSIAYIKDILRIYHNI